MKQIFRYITVLLMLFVSTTASAQSTIKVMTITNGTVKADKSSASIGDEVTITVTPNSGYYFLKKDLKVEKTVDPNVARTRVVIPVEETVTISGDDPDDLSTERTYTFVVTEDGYEYQVTASFTECTEITEDMVSLSTNDYTYNGYEHKPSVYVDGLSEDEDYVVSFSETSWINAGTYSIIVSGINKYKGSVTKTYTISPASSSMTSPKAKKGLVYSGAAQDLISAGSSTTGTVKYSLDGETYDSTIPQGTDAKEYTVYYMLVGNKNYSDIDAKSLYVTIAAKTVSSPTITLSATSFVYDGNAKEPTVTVKDGETKIPATEYTVSYKNNTNVGTAKVTITDNTGGNYTVNGSATFTITASGESSIVNEEEAVIVNGETLYELSEEVAEAIQETIETDIALPVEADSRVQVTDDGGLKFSQGSDLQMGLLDLKEKDIVKFVFTGRLFGNSSKLRQKNAASRGTRAAGDMELFSEVEYEVIESGDQTVTVKLTESETTVETITVTKPGGSVSITISSSGKNSYTTAEALDFSEFDDLKAYVATGYEGSGTIWLTRVKQVPANTPILIKGKAGKTYEVPVMDKCVAYFENMFQGSAENDVNINISSADGKWNNYYMASGSFKKVTGKRTIGKGKCYLQLPASFNAAKAGAAQTVKISDSGKSSYAPPVDIDLTNVEGLKAYAATGYDAASQTIWLTRIFKIQAGEGVLLKGEKGNTYTLPSAATQAYYGNMFVGNIGNKITINETSDDGAWTNFYLASGSFKKVSGSREIGTNKSYLQLPTSLLVSSARGKNTAGIEEWLMEELETETILLGSIGGEDGDGTTRINAIANDNAQPDVYYNLQGQRINNPKKGLYIKNGKKVVIRSTTK